MGPNLWTSAATRFWPDFSYAQTARILSSSIFYAKDWLWGQALLSSSLLSLSYFNTATFRGLIQQMRGQCPRIPDYACGISIPFSSIFAEKAPQAREPAVLSSLRSLSATPRNFTTRRARSEAETGERGREKDMRTHPHTHTQSAPPDGYFLLCPRFGASQCPSRHSSPMNCFSRFFHQES